MSRPLSCKIGYVLGAVLAALWFFVAISKTIDLIAGTSSDSWAAQFLPTTLVAIVIAELYLGAMLAFKPLSVVHLWAIGLLALFAGAFVLWPLEPEQSCGCAGAAGAALGIDAVSPFVRIAMLGAVHLLSAAFIAPSRATETAQFSPA